MAQARFTLVGRVTPVGEDEQPAAREAFLGTNPDSFWVRPCSHHRRSHAAGPAPRCQTLLAAFLRNSHDCWLEPAAACT